MAEWHVDATKFQNQLGELATAIAYKVQREGILTATANLLRALRPRTRIVGKWRRSSPHPTYGSHRSAYIGGSGVYQPSGARMRHQR